MVTAEELADSVSPEGVHSHIPQRPVFTDISRPSVAEVASLTMSTAQAVIGAVGGSLSDQLKAFAVVVVETAAAAKVEQSYFPEQQAGNAGPAALLWDEYTRMLSSLVAQQLKISGGGKSAGFGMISLWQRTTGCGTRALDAEPDCVNPRVDPAFYE
jgi:hypothetical protein